MFSPSDLMQWSLAIFLLLLEGIIIVLIWKRVINFEKLISEQDGSASFSRFQFLIFTFIIASAYIVLALQSVNIAKIPDSGLILPEIPDGVLILIGMSGGSYLGSKLIETTAGKNISDPVTASTLSSSPAINAHEQPPVG